MAWHLNLGQATFAGLSSMENQDKYLEPNSLKLCWLMHWVYLSAKWKKKMPECLTAHCGPQKETLRQKHLELVKKNPENSVSIFTGTAWILTVFNFAANNWILIQFKIPKTKKIKKKISQRYLFLWIISNQSKILALNWYCQNDIWFFQTRILFPTQIWLNPI